MQTPPKRKKTLQIVKGRRFSNAHPILSTDIVLRNLRNGIETSLMLDLNVIADIEDVVLGKSTLEKTGLDKVIPILNRTRELFLVPGFGLHEAPQSSFLASKIAAYNIFLKTYCPTYSDAPDSIPMFLDLPLEKNTNRGYFHDLPELKRQMFAPFYASMLKMRLLTFDNTRLPSEKFFDILRFHCDELNLVAAVPLELAKYVFCPTSNISHPAFREFCSKIRGIIVKERPTSSYDIYKDCLNATWDMFYYQSSCVEYVLDSGKQDLWLLTGDQGLACLADAIYYDARYDQEMGAVTYHHIPDRDKYTYFRQCDRLLESKMKQRRQAGVLFRREEVTSNSFEAITRCEQQLVEMLDKL